MNPLWPARIKIVPLTVNPKAPPAGTLTVDQGNGQVESYPFERVALDTNLAPHDADLRIGGTLFLGAEVWADFLRERDAQ